MEIFWNCADESTSMSFPTQWMQRQPSLQRPVVPIPTSNSMQHFLPNVMGSSGSFLGFMPTNPVPTQTIPPSVQVNVPAMRVKTTVLYPSSVKEAFLDWNLIIQTTLSGQDGDIGNSFCLANGVHMTGQGVMNSRKLKQCKHGPGAVVNPS